MGRLTDDMFALIEQGPDYYFACMPWLIAVGRMGVGSVNFETQGPWFTHLYDAQFGLNGELPIVDMFSARPGEVKQDGPVPDAMANFYTGPDLAGREFDDRLKYLEPQVLLEPVADQSQPHWRLIEAQWADENEAGGKAYVYVKALDESGRPLEGAIFQADRGDAVDRAETKGHWDQYWGNYLLTGLLGTYTVSMAQDDLPSDQLVNLGMGTEDLPTAYVATSFFLTFQKVKGVAVEKSKPDKETAQPKPQPKPVTGHDLVSQPTLKPEPSKPVAPPEAVVPPKPVAPVEPPAPVTPAPPQVVQPVPESPQPPVQPDTSAIGESLRAAARRYILPINRNSAMYQYAQANNLGDFISAEFPLRHEGIEYRGQVFEKGIVYVKADGSGVITHIAL
jgi:hypothetical protein